MSESKIKRRRFLADILFVGGAVTAAAVLAKATQPEAILATPTPVTATPVVPATPATSPTPVQVPVPIRLPEPRLGGLVAPPEPHLKGNVAQPIRLPKH